MSKAKFGVIGAGHIGKRHAEMISRHSDAELVAMCDRRTKEECEATFDVPFFTDPNEMLNAHPEIDVISICTPNGLHAQHALVALDHKKHIVIEKPMGLTKADCEKVIYSALNVSRQVFCVMQNRYSPPSTWIKEMVDSGNLAKSSWFKSIAIGTVMIGTTKSCIGRVRWNLMEEHSLRSSLTSLISCIGSLETLITFKRNLKISYIKRTLSLKTVASLILISSMEGWAL